MAVTAVTAIPAATTVMAADGDSACIRKPASSEPSGVTPQQYVRNKCDKQRVTLPHQGRSAFVPVHIPVCSGRGHASLSVQAIQARPGVPGYATVP